MLAVSTDRFPPHLPLRNRLEALAKLGLRAFEIRQCGPLLPTDLPLARWKENGWTLAALRVAHEGGAGLAQVDRAGRELAIGETLAAARWALSRRCPLVVITTGPIALPQIESREAELCDTLQREGEESIEQECDALLESRSQIVPAQIDRLCRSLHHLAKAEPQVRWCIETPAGLSHLPLPEELNWIIEDLGPQRIGYWHRTGHVERLARMARIPRETWVERFGPHTAGIQLDDLTSDLELTLPAMGGADLTELTRDLPPRLPRVVSIPAEATEFEIRAALEMLESSGIATPRALE